jgi:uncharacterized membrane protein/protein-disulfide isomerase
MAIQGNNAQPIKPLPYHFYYSWVFFLTLCGLAVSVYLSISHYRVYTDIGYKSFCAISRAINCDTVSQSNFAIFLGVPLPVWGCVAYCAFLFLLIFQFKTGGKERLWPTLFAVSILFSLHSVFLALISTIYIKSYCLMCIVDYTINFSLLFMIMIIRKRFDTDRLFNGISKDLTFISTKRAFFFAWLTGALSVCLLLLVYFPAYWEFSMPSIDQTTKMGVTERGFPWIGSENPEIVIVEYTDYQCFQCKKMHFFLRQLIGEYPDRLQLVHRHFPMDHAVNPLVKEPYHVGSGVLAILSLYAKEKGRFWEFNDMMFEMAKRATEIDTKQIAEKFGFAPKAFALSLNSRDKRRQLNRDIIDGLKLGITGTPAYQIDGGIYQGYIPPEIIKKIMN